MSGQKSNLIYGLKIIQLFFEILFYYSVYIKLKGCFPCSLNSEMCIQPITIDFQLGSSKVFQIGQKTINCWIKQKEKAQKFKAPSCDF